MTPKRTLPDHLRKEIPLQNKVWFDKFRIESGSRKEYFPDTQEFLEFCSNQHDRQLKQISRPDVELYITTLKQFTKSAYTINRRLSAIGAFANFLRSHYPKVFGDKFLSNLPAHELTDQNPTHIRALSLEQISYIRKYNRNSITSAKDQYIFELFFQLGIDKNDLVAREFPSIRSADVDEIIARMLEGEVVEGTINSYFTRITKYLQDLGKYNKPRKINSYDLTESHKAYFWKCPNCNRTFENIAKNWVLARVDFENPGYQDEFRIVCVLCKGENSS